MGVFRSDGNNIYLNAPYCEFYIPMYYFDSSKTSSLAEDNNETIRVLGLFDVGVFDGSGKLTEMKLFNVPTMININVYDSEVRDVKLGNGEVTQCKVVKYLKDAKIMVSSTVQDDENSKAYLQYITGGNLPTFIPYSKLLTLWRKNMSLNGVYFGVPSCYLELILAVMNRNPSDLSQKFASIAGKEDVSDYGYATASIRQICQYNSTFTALTYEDMDSMITSSLNRSRENKQETISPVEQIIKF